MELWLLFLMLFLLDVGAGGLACILAEFLYRLVGCEHDQD